MFGWEFPPHISGGLGTACAGLTKALVKENVKVLFVVPKIRGGEKVDRTHFINASAIPFLQKKLPDLKSGISFNAKKSVFAKGKSEIIQTTISDSFLTRIEIPSPLSPYTTASEVHSSFGLEQWNYSFESKGDQPISTAHLPKSSNANLIEGHNHPIKEAYAFSGSYGPELLEEVERYAQVAAEIASQYSFDVIHAHDWMTFLAGIEAKKISGKPLVVHVHATEIDRSGMNVDPRVFAIEKEGMRQADKVVTVSHWTKNIALKHYLADDNKIEVVHNGITPKKEAKNNSFPPFLGSHIVTFLGRITHQKGPLYFVEAARRVHDQFPDAQFVVAGSGDQLPLMIERIAQVRLSSNFHFTGFLKGKDIDRVWAMSNVYVMPSVSEPFGIAPLEAIQAGVPVIISKQAGVSEVMSHAIKVDFWNSEDLAEAICSVLRFKSLANTLKKNGAEQIKSITWDKAAKKINNLYYELSKKREKQEKSGSVFSGSSTKKAAHDALL